MATKKTSTAADPASSIPDTVIIEGSVTPAVGILKRGERATVPFTPNVEDLIRRGFIDIVARSVDATLPPAPEPEPTVPGPKPDQTVPSVPSGTNQDLVEATPPAPEPEPEPNPDVDNGLVEVANPDVDNSLVNPNGK